MKRLRTLLVVMLITVLSLGCLSLNVKAEEAKETQEVTEVEQLDSQYGTDVVLEDDNNIDNLNNSSQEDGETILEEAVEVNQDSVNEELVPLQSGTEEIVEDVSYDPTLESVEITPTEGLIIKFDVNTVTDKNGVAVFEGLNNGVNQAAKWLNHKRTHNISDCCYGIIDSVKGYRFKFIVE